MTCILTLGHSDRGFADVLKLLRDHDVRHLVDIRRFPGSRKHPQWNRAAIISALPSDMRYTWIPELGGRRRTPSGASSPNGAWRVKAFQAYADHMLGQEFAHGLAHLISLSAHEQTAVMCSEAVPGAAIDVSSRTRYSSPVLRSNTSFPEHAPLLELSATTHRSVTDRSSTHHIPK